MCEESRVLELKPYDASNPNSEKEIIQAKSHILESSMINVGKLIVSTLSATAISIARLIVMGIEKLMLLIEPLQIDVHILMKRLIRFAGIKFVSFADSVISAEKKFTNRRYEIGLGRSLILLFTDIVKYLKLNKKVLKTAVNYTIPVFSIMFLVAVITDTASVDYGISVGYNGQEIGVVSEESVINEAQKAISERVTYYDTGSLNSVAASFSIKPLSAQDEVIDENALVNIIAEQLPEPVISDDNTPAENIDNEPVFESLYNDSQPDNNDNSSEKVRAYVITIDGETVGAVHDFSQIEQFLSNTKTRYASEDVISVSFDKEVEYGYEQYVDPEQIVSGQDIVDLLTSVVSEPVYYEVADGDNPWDIAINNGLSVEDLKDCFATYNGEVIPDITEFCPVGAMIQLSAEVPYLQALITKEVVYRKKIKFDVVKTEDPELYKTETKIDVKGVEGEKRITALVTYKNDTAISRDILHEEIISEPSTEYERVGTRETTTPVSKGSGGSGDYFWPLDGGYISAYQGDNRGHKGIDVAAPYGTPIYAASSGTVTRAGNKGDGYGNCVFIEHDDGNKSVYAHQSSVAISYGEYVVKGQLIGYVGSTGDSTGNHLHFEIRSSNGKYINPLDYVSQ